jgi:hypothetical protein
MFDRKSVSVNGGARVVFVFNIQRDTSAYPVSRDARLNTYVEHV